ncbi:MULTISPECIES: hypothetical protein [Nocardioides]|uniref:Polysaccharide biosynthesis protein n=1 Tax=Nocardioides vastitatis TaxID=2568655 RepID=A0ABW0ZCR5_9ACTN|nr:hypothetical protein [Nocardioides sp.]THJ02313.1 hypothetical protein E7Z54_10250 [Nocardioides sp.]
MNRVVRLMLGFGALPFLSAVAPLLLLPIIARIGGPAGWIAILTGQALGSFAGVLIMAGWTIHGQARVAASPTGRARHRIYAAALQRRVKAALVVLPCGCLLTAMVVDEYDVDALLMFVAMAMSGLSLTWFATGAGRPSWIVLYEAGPRLVAVALSAASIVATGQLWIYPVLLIVATALGVTSFHRAIMGQLWPRYERGDRVVARKEDIYGATASVTGAVYSSAPVPVASAALSEAWAAGLASADRLYRYATLVIVALANALQAWVLDPMDQRRRSRAQIALVMHTVLGLIGLGLLTLVGPTATAWLFGSDVTASPGTCWWFGMAFLGINISTALIRNIAIPTGRSGLVVLATVVSAVTGVAVMVMQETPTGIAMGLAASEVLSAVVVGAGLLMTARRQARTAAEEYTGLTHS